MVTKRTGLIAGLTALVLGIAAGRADAATTTNNWPGITNVYAGPVTNNCKVKVVRKPEYKVIATAGAGGTISGTTNNWCLEDSTVSLSSSPNTGYDHDYWTNVPSTVTATNASINWQLTGANAKPWTNAAAVYKPKTFTYVFEDSTAGVGTTNIVTWGATTNNVFPEYVNNPTNSGIRYRTEAIEATDVNVSTNAP